jgi:PadR family transcriptional regulator, regulatory protein AphA
MAKEETASPLPVLLGFLMSGPAHPYELYQRFDRELGRVWRVGQSHLYAYLKRIEAEGMAKVEVEEQESRPARNVYRLTSAGRRRFLEWLRKPSRHVRNIRLEFLVRLYFFRALELEGQDELVLAQKAVIEERLASLERSMRETDSGSEYWCLVLDFRRGEMEAILAWLDRCHAKKFDS